MKKTIAIILAAAILTTGALAFGAGTGQAVYTMTQTLADGLSYRNDVSRTASGSTVETFTLETAPGGSVYPIVLACDTIYGGMTVTEIIAYAQGLGYNVVGAVNADFGFWDTRIPCGMVVEDGVYKASPDGGNAIAFTEGGAVASYMPAVDITLTNDRTGESVSTDRLNKTRQDGGLFLYSEHFSTVSTRTTAEGWFLRLKVLEGELALGGSMSLEVAEIVTDKTAVQIGEGNLILTATAVSGLEGELSKFSVGDKVSLKTVCSDESLVSADWVSGCGNYIVKDGAFYTEEYWDSAVTGVNPRTAIGIKADGSVVYYVMDGRSTASAGATMKQLAQDMISMGCVSAVNMDGGGSTVMALRTPGKDGFTIVNSPSDGSLRSVCSYILFVTDAAPGAAKRLFAMEDGAVVLAGSSLKLSYAATDAALRTLPVSGVSATAKNGGVSGNTYTAPASAEVDIISLSGGGLAGTASINVITKADSLAVNDADTGKAVSAVTAELGDSVSLAASARYLSRDVAMDASAVSYSVEGEVGSITPDGVFTADGVPGAEGKITVSAAGLTKSVSVKLAFEFPDMLDHWARAYVKTLYDAGAVEGTSADSFSPDGGMRRGDFVLLLWRAAGKPTPASLEAFADVPADAYYAEAVAWAKERGIAEGDGGNFEPQGYLNREQGFTLLYRALPALNVSMVDGSAADLAAFTDAAQVSDWAVTAAATLVKMGVVEGDAGLLSPKAGLTRAQMCKLLCEAVYK